MENPVFFVPNLEIVLPIYQLLKDIGPVQEISRKEGSCMDGVAGYIRLTHTEGNDSPGNENQEDGSERKTGFCLCMRQNQNRGADGFLHPDPVGALIQFCVVR